MADQFKDEYARISCSPLTPLNVYDRLTMIDLAYNADERESCVEMIDDLYAIFDRIGTII